MIAPLIQLLNSTTVLGLPASDRIDEIRRAIKAFRDVELQSADIEQLRLMLPPILDGHLKRVSYVQPGQYLFRARELEEKPTNTRELRQPPKECVCMNRANRDNNPIFYCCASDSTALIEIHAKPGMTIALSRWQTIKPLSVNNVGYTKDVFEKLNANRPTPSYGEIGVPLTEANMIVDRFLNDEFTEYVPRDKKLRYLYKRTVAIAERMFSDEIFDGLVYPSIAHKANGDNFAFKPCCIENKLKMYCVWYIHIDSADESAFNIKPLDFANSFQDDGTIEWKGREAAEQANTNQNATTKENTL